MLDGFRVLDPREPDEAELWIRAWRRLEVPEVYAHPAYVALWTQRGESPCAAVQADGEGAIIFPFLVRPIAREPWAPDDEQAVDIASPYGYGGAFVSPGTTKRDAVAFWNSFDAWCRDINAITSFVRLSLFDDALPAPRAVVRVAQRNVVRDLSIDGEATWRDYDHKVRKNVNRARQCGLTVVIERGPESLVAFNSLYRETMKRRDASAFYFFSDDFFAGLTGQLREHCVLATVADEGGPVSVELLLDSGRKRLYSFLGGTIDRGFPVRANDLLKHAVIEWARAEGYDSYVLGGGLSDGDGIFRHKRSFAPHGVLPFRVAQSVLDAAQVDRLTRLRALDGASSPTHEAFFPPYRRSFDG